MSYVTAASHKSSFWKRLGAAAALLAATGGAIFGAYRSEISAARKAAAQGGRLAQTAVGPIEYAIAGSGPPVLMIHGAGGGYDQGLYVGEMFGDGVQIVAPSRFGYLRTPTPQDISPAAQADAHAALLDRLGIYRVVVAGVSAGAPSAIEFALRHPERVSALVLLVPRAYAPGEQVGATRSASNQAVLKIIMAGADFGYWAASRIARSSVVRFLGVPPELEATLPAQARADVTRVIRSIQPLSQRLQGLRNDSAATIGPWPLGRIQAPTLVVSAKDDLFNTLPAARFTAQHIPGAKLVVLESGGHLFANRRSDVQTVLGDFLTGAGVKRSPLTPLRAVAR
jgi:pimeloyl-ACP methyl ester carboxylesterase